MNPKPTKEWKVVWTTERGSLDVTEHVKAKTESLACDKLYRKHGDICIVSIKEAK